MLTSPAMQSVSTGVRRNEGGVSDEHKPPQIDAGELRVEGDVFSADHAHSFLSFGTHAIQPFTDSLAA
jgi:hypothetical protein